VLNWGKDSHLIERIELFFFFKFLYFYLFKRINLHITTSSNLKYIAVSSLSDPTKDLKIVHGSSLMRKHRTWHFALGMP
jgi:hypothetical protein